MFSLKHAECSVLCVLEQPRVDDFRTGLFGSNWSYWLNAGPDSTGTFHDNLSKHIAMRTYNLRTQ